MFGIHLKHFSFKQRKDAINTALKQTCLKSLFIHDPNWLRLGKVKADKNQKFFTFFCREIPILRSLICEKCKRITSVDFNVMPPWEHEISSFSAYDADYNNEELSTFIKCSPDEFFYFLQLDKDNDVVVTLTPICYFKQCKKRYDGDLSLYISQLPSNDEFAGVTEIGNDSFIIRGKSLDQLNREMLALGYVYDHCYSEFMRCLTHTESVNTNRLV